MKRYVGRSAIVVLALAAPQAIACGNGTTALFGCEAGKRKFIELCAPYPIDALAYRFGSVDDNGEETKLELEYPRDSAGSLGRFFGATYTHKGVYTQSIRFASGAFDYTVFTRARGLKDLDAGVLVRDRKAGKTSTVLCTERPRFYIHELAGLVACDPDTPVGTACIK